MQNLHFEELERNTVANCGIFTVVSSRRRNPLGIEANFTVLETSDWVNVIPLVKDKDGNDCFLMVRQYRHGSKSTTLEFPGGMVDAQETDIQGAALRELLEETGYSAGACVKIGDANPNSAFLENRVHTYLAWNLQKTHSTDLDENEFVEEVLVSVEDSLNGMGTGEFDNAIMVVAMFWYMRYTQKMKGNKE